MKNPAIRFSEGEVFILLETIMDTFVAIYDGVKVVDFSKKRHGPWYVSETNALAWVKKELAINPDSNRLKAILEALEAKPWL